MRIAFLVPSVGLREGQGGVNHALLRHIVDAGHRVDLFTSLWTADALLPGVRIRRVPRLPAWQLGNQAISLAVTSARLRRSDYDVVHADAGVTLRRADVVSCHTLNDRWRSLPPQAWRERGARGLNQAVATRFKARLEARQYRQARAVLANSRATAADLEAHGVDPAHITVVPFGIDAERFRPPTPAERADARASFGIPPDTFVAAFVGAHGPRKGLPAAIDGAGAAGATLLAAGETRGGTWVREAEARRVAMIAPGKLADVRVVYWAADALVYPSLYDAFGLAVLEAMGCGLPVVVSAASGASEIVGDAGIVLGDPSGPALAEAIGAIRADGARAASMGAAARRIASGRTWDKAGDIVLRVYEQVQQRD